jgi:glycosyltransferase involved in cell wall biosynthesis
MKLFFVHERFGTFGGAEGNVRQTAAELSSRGHTVGLIHGFEGPDPVLARDAFSHCVPLARTHNRNRVRTALKEFNPDLVYVHKMADLEVVETLVESKVPGVRMVHDHEMYCMRGYKYHYLSRNICARPASPYCVFPCGASLARNHERGFPVKWVSYAAKKREIKLNQKFQRMVVYSQYTKDELLRNGFPSEKIEIHAPIGTQDAALERSSFSDRNLVLFVGQVIRGKGVDVLLEALAKVRVPFECLILGEGNHRPYCERLCRKLGLADRVRFKGFVPQPDLKQYYLECSVFAMSSLWPEPFGMAGPEAMRYGLPVVAFDAGGIKEWLADGQSGHLVPWGDSTAFAARLEELLLNKNLGREMGERGRQWVSSHYDFSNYIDELENLFARVMSEGECR